MLECCLKSLGSIVMFGSKWLDHFILSVQSYLGQAREGNVIFFVRGESGDGYDKRMGFTL